MQSIISNLWKEELLPIKDAVFFSMEELHPVKLHPFPHQKLKWVRILIL